MCKSTGELYRKFSLVIPARDRCGLLSSRTVFQSSAIIPPLVRRTTSIRRVPRSRALLRLKPLRVKLHACQLTVYIDFQRALCVGARARAQKLLVIPVTVVETVCAACTCLVKHLRGEAGERIVVVVVVGGGRGEGGEKQRSITAAL